MLFRKILLSYLLSMLAVLISAWAGGVDFTHRNLGLGWSVAAGFLIGSYIAFAIYLNDPKIRRG